eukprot:TRINITY_DN6177_c0_g1_i1.p1 TRINITY_DN6177_c0_g1~~TRINITY_DN6177_c0_g1_i1.p1  ORF type:complete len:351 (-),score=58.55 TRINITY_DN6177_c0_g1_i1:51-1103(-)
MSSSRIVLSPGAASGSSIAEAAPLPQPGYREVVVRVRACALSYLDVLSSTGVLQKLLPNREIGLGFEISGTVELVGEAATFAVGEEVAGLIPLDHDVTRGGCCAELCLLGDYFLVAKPANVSHTNAAASLLAGLRAFHALTYKLKVASGDTLLVLNASCPENSILCQVAAAWGVKVIRATPSRPAGSTLAPLLSVDGVFEFSCADELQKYVLAETGGMGVDHIADFPDSQGRTVVATPSLPTEEVQNALIRCLAPHGHWIDASAPPEQIDPPQLQQLWSKDCTVSYSFEAVWLLAASQQGRYLRLMNELMEYLVAGKVKPPQHSTLKMADVVNVIQQPHTISSKLVIVYQ